LVSVLAIREGPGSLIEPSWPIDCRCDLARAEVIIIEVDCDPALYSKVNEILGLVPSIGASGWPNGLLTHIGVAASVRFLN
jgi:hypothetical protein